MEFLIYALSLEKPSEYLRKNKEKLFAIIPELSFCENFNQNNKWHMYDVLEHIFHVVDNASNNLILRMAALFHDIGKPFVYKEDEFGVGHFWGHWDKSYEIFLKFAEKYEISQEERNMISNLILYHDLNVSKCDNKEMAALLSAFDDVGIELLFQLKRSDLLAQSEEFHYMLDVYEEQKREILNRKK